MRAFQNVEVEVMEKSEERRIAKEFSHRSPMSPREKRLALASMGGLLARASSLAPSSAAALLPDIWEKRRHLAWGFATVVR